MKSWLHLLDSLHNMTDLQTAYEFLLKFIEMHDRFNDAGIRRSRQAVDDFFKFYFPCKISVQNGIPFRDLLLLQQEFGALQHLCLRKSHVFWFNECFLYTYSASLYNNSVDSAELSFRDEEAALWYRLRNQ